MDKMEELRARELVDELKIGGANFGILSLQGQVILRLPGAPYRDIPMRFFTEDDLNNALNFLPA